MDTKSQLVLKILAQQCKDGSYKVVETSDIIMSLPKHYRMDTAAVKHILTYLERQDIISIKYDDDNVYCLAILPYGFELLENSDHVIKRKQPESNTFRLILFCFIASFIGSFLGSLIVFFMR